MEPQQISTGILKVLGDDTALLLLGNDSEVSVILQQPSNVHWLSTGYGKKVLENLKTR